MRASYASLALDTTNLPPEQTPAWANLWDTHTVLIGERIRAIREAKNLSQGDIEKRSGLFRVYISRVENGHLVPSIETLEKLARALEVPLYQLFYEGKKRPLPPHLPRRKRAAEITWGKTRKEIYFWEKLRGFLARMSESDRRLLLYVARKMARRQENARHANEYLSTCLLRPRHFLRHEH